ncbi:MAG: TIGR04388 family protein, partial [Leptospirales bacterium]
MGSHRAGRPRRHARNAWQAAVADRIDGLIADADAGGMPPGQQSQLRNDLEAARDVALGDWDAAADAADTAQHEAFLLTLLSTQSTPPLPTLTAFDTAALDGYITAANNATSSPSIWQSMVEDGIQDMFDAWRPGADPAIATAATDAVSLAVANGLIHSARAQQLAESILKQDMETDAYDAYVNAGLAYMSDSFVAKVDDVFSGIPAPTLDSIVMDFNANSMSPVFASALTAANLYDWALLVDNGKAGKRQEYFTAVSGHLDQVIDSAVAASGLNAADASVYRSYLQYSLANEAQVALQTWESDANALILQRRSQFLQSLTPVVATVNESGAPTINIAPLTTQAFNAAPLLTLFDQARNAANTSQWDAVVLNQTQVLAAAWNTQAGATIDSLVTQYTAGVTDDTFETFTVDGVQEGQGVKVNSLLAYQDYVRNFLEDQRRLQFAAWVKQAEQVIGQGREAFLAELSAAAVATQQEENAAAGEITGEKTDTVANEADRAETDPVTGEAKSQEQEARDYLTQVRRQLQLDEMSWRSDWRDRRDTGLNQYNKALSLLDQNRDAYMSTMQQADITWQTNLAMMEQFEGNVRGGLSTVTAQLQQMIAMNPMFHTDVT